MQQHRTQIYRYVRRQHDRYQARVWINDDVGHLNLGTYPSECEAWAAVKAYLNKGQMPTGLLPKYARKFGDVYRGVRVAKGKKIKTGLYLFPELAAAAVEKHAPRGRGRRRR